jgi:hypothetical protein
MDADEPDRLPPLEPDGPELDDENLSLDQFLEPFPQDDAGEDDQPFSDLDIGITLDGEETEAELDGEPVHIELRELVGAEEPSGAPDSDEMGPADFDASLGLDAEPAAFGDDDAEGAEDETTLEERLPPLDADADGDAEGQLGFAEFVAPEERPLPPAETPWLVSGPRFHVEAVGALTVSEGHVLAGSGDLLWIEAGSDSVLRVAAEDNRVTSVCLLGASRDSALCATAAGRLLRRARLGPAAMLNHFREVAGLVPGQAVALELCQMGVERPSSVLLRVDNGRVLASNDSGTTFQALPLPGRASALSTTGQPAVALLSTRSGAELWRFDEADQGVGLRLPPEAATVAEGPAPLVAACGETIAIADGERGAVLSSNGAATFSGVAGCVNATALAAGMLRGRASVWVAIYRETEDATDIVQIDAATLALGVIARVEQPEDPKIDPHDRLEQARVQRLVWDPSSERLWAAGGFGLVRFAPPP